MSTEEHAYALELLRAVKSYDDANQSDLPLGLLDSIHEAVAAASSPATPEGGRAIFGDDDWRNRAAGLSPLGRISAPSPATPAAMCANCQHADPHPGGSCSEPRCGCRAYALCVSDPSPATPEGGRKRADRAEAWIVKIAAELCESAHGDGEGGPACQDCYDLTCSMLDTPTVGEWFTAALAAAAPSTLPAETREGREALAQQIEAALADVPRGHGSEYDAGRAVGLRRALRIVRAASPAVSLPGEEKKP